MTSKTKTMITTKAVWKRKRFKSVYDRIGRRVRGLRLGRGWTIEVMSGECGLAIASLYRIEAGNIDMKLSTILILSKLFGLTIAELIHG